MILTPSSCSRRLKIQVAYMGGCSIVERGIIHLEEIQQDNRI